MVSFSLMNFSCTLVHPTMLKACTACASPAPNAHRPGVLPGGRRTAGTGEFIEVPPIGRAGKKECH
jgi:hypothetical protein